MINESWLIRFCFNIAFHAKQNIFIGLNDEWIRQMNHCNMIDDSIQICCELLAKQFYFRVNLMNTLSMTNAKELSIQIFVEFHRRTLVTASLFLNIQGMHKSYQIPIQICVLFHKTTSNLAALLPGTWVKINSQ